MKRRQSHISNLLIGAAFADVALCGALDAHLVCLPGSFLLSADPCYTLLGVAS